jgi:hypothetical protein
MKLVVIKSLDCKPVISFETLITDVDQFVATALKMGVEADYEQLVSDFADGADRTYIVGLEYDGR